MNIINNDWPVDQLETINECPYCNSATCTVAYTGTQDWTFFCAPGKWTYWDCQKCNSLYLNPRPTQLSIGNAYKHYYTHIKKQSGFIRAIKDRIKNEYLYYYYSANLKPRIHAPKLLRILLAPCKYIIKTTFELNYLVKLPKADIIDVGCGNGNLLAVAQQLGWNVTGLEIDENAVAAANELGLNVLVGSYKKLQELNKLYDCIVCSHVIEHVHKPIELLDILINSLKPNGVLLLSCPNANSHMRYQFNHYWRGLEAPRHLAIPSMNSLMDLIQNRYKVKILQHDVFYATSNASKAITKLNLNNNYVSQHIKAHTSTTMQPSDESDFIQFAIYKNT